MSVEGDLLAHKARALAQSHPLTPLAKRFADRASAAEQQGQPVKIVADWSMAALTAGYCVRRVEEHEAGLALAATDGGAPDLDEVESTSLRIISALRDPDAEPAPTHRFLLDEALVVAALDRVITSEISRREDNVRAGVDAEAWAEFEDYLAWWVIKGYALREAEAVVGALA